MISLLVASLVLHNRDLRQIKHELEQLTNIDPLTGVLNRRGVWNEMERLIEEPDKRFVLCYLDINRFKEINDTYGHTTGDIVLQQFAKTFERSIDTPHLFARIGGDEFLIVFLDMDDARAVDTMLEKAAQALYDVQLVGRPRNISIQFSVGKAVYPTDGSGLDDLIGLADGAMYQEKNLDSIKFSG